MSLPYEKGCLLQWRHHYIYKLNCNHQGIVIAMVTTLLLLCPFPWWVKIKQHYFYYCCFWLLNSLGNTRKKLKGEQNWKSSILTWLRWKYTQNHLLRNHPSPTLYAQATLMFLLVMFRTCWDFPAYEGLTKRIMGQVLLFNIFSEVAYSSDVTFFHIRPIGADHQSRLCSHFPNLRAGITQLSVLLREVIKGWPNNQNPIYPSHFYKQLL